MVLAAVLAASCALGAEPAADPERLPRMDVAFGFEARHRCAGVSPEIRLTGVPAATERYDVKLTDLDLPTYPHWEQRVPARGSTIPEGAGTGYFGPCPGPRPHRYEISLVARDGGGRPLAYGSAVVSASSD